MKIFCKHGICNINLRFNKFMEEGLIEISLKIKDIEGIAFNSTEG